MTRIVGRILAHVWVDTPVSAEMGSAAAAVSLGDDLTLFIYDRTAITNLRRGLDEAEALLAAAAEATS